MFYEILIFHLLLSGRPKPNSANGLQPVDNMAM